MRLLWRWGSRNSVAIGVDMLWVASMSSLNRPTPRVMLVFDLMPALWNWGEGGGQQRCVPRAAYYSICYSIYSIFTHFYLCRVP
jgi:hypothetical protein